jgi:tetratricopeptide (TPR) repeat protein
MQGTMAQLQQSPREIERWKKAQQNLLGGETASALASYQALARRYPNIAELWFELGNAAAAELDFLLANRAYARARELAPGNASLVGLIGQQYQSLRQLDDARACYERSLEINPDLVDARINLAVWFERERRLDEAWECVRECLARFPNDDQARYFEAFLLHRRKHHEEAEAKLRDLIKEGPSYPYVKYAAPHLLGVVLDQLGNHAEAMKWLLEAKARVRTITDTSLLERNYDENERMRRQLLADLTPAMIKRWRDESQASENPEQIAFLGGHPRSGTTLMEQILDAHPKVLAFDEPVAMSQEISAAFKRFSKVGRTAHALDELRLPHRTEMRERYLKSLLREIPGDSAGQWLLDKNPSSTMSLNLLLRVFPEMKIIIALRDPRDVVISCFFTNILLNATNVNFLSLERTVKHYSDLMDVWLRMREIGGFDWIETRYEDVVSDLEEEGRKVTDFLGLGWHPDQVRFYENARRKVLYAPTYHDVTQPIHQRSIGRWEHHADALEPYQEKLESYCRDFGY